MPRILKTLFGCGHARTTFPRSPKHLHGIVTRVTCLDCGKEFRYDWNAMTRCEELAAAPVVDWELLKEAE